MRDTMRLHTEEYDLMQRTPYLAREDGLGAAVEGGAGRHQRAPARFRRAGPRDPRREVRRVRRARHQHLEPRGHDGRVVVAAGLPAQPDAARAAR